MVNFLVSCKLEVGVFLRNGAQPDLLNLLSPFLERDDIDGLPCYLGHFLDGYLRVQLRLLELLFDDCTAVGVARA